jgi:hypothetical protein
MRCAGFDLSSQSGVGVWDGNSPAPQLFPKRVLYWDRDAGEMLETWRKWIGRFFAEHDPEVIAVEAPVAGGHGDLVTMNRQAKIAGMLEWACHVKGVPLHIIQPGTWRKSFIGFGARGKRVNVDWKRLAKQRCKALGWDHHGDHNVAEAGGVLNHLIIEILGLSPPWKVSDSLILPLPEIFNEQRT